MSDSEAQTKFLMAAELEASGSYFAAVPIGRQDADMLYLVQSLPRIFLARREKAVSSPLGRETI
jgi:hypothetical protein